LKKGRKKGRKDDGSWMMEVYMIENIGSWL
jgi:hypothetical protein